jgi:predicted lipid-binding transport protein (Tim44 family)/uncharacterized tellurite resistance protein B-like protein
MLLSFDLWARAGGGGSFRGGGFSGGRSSGRGGSGGDGFIIYLLIRLFFAHPIIGSIVVIIFFIISYLTKKPAQNLYAGNTIKKATRAGAIDIENSRLLKLQELDPTFDKQHFIKRIENGFLKLQDAWCMQNIEKVSPFISDGIAERFQLQFLELQSNGEQNLMDNIQIHSLDIVHIEFDDVFNTLTVRINASAIDYNIDVKTEKFLSGSKHLEAFTEYWTFIRRPGVQTISGNGLIEGNCPNCGYLLEMNESAKCESCGALIKSGEYDWVLSEITQASEWRPVEKSELLGVEELRAVDPLFSVQQLEDRVSVMFWRYMTSLRTGKITSLSKVASHEFCEKIKPRLDFADNGFRFISSDAAVGSVETIGILIEEPYDKALVKVRWSAARTRIDRDGKVKKFQDVVLNTSCFVLIRQNGFQTSDSSLSSAHCPSCGAPVGNSLVDSCEYCGAILNDPSNSWILDDLDSFYNPKMRDLIQQVDMEIEVAAEPRGIETLAWMIFTMLSDSVIDDKEIELLKSYSDARNIPMSQVENMIKAAQEGNLETPNPRDKNEAKEWLKAVARMALADGFISKEEKTILYAMADKLNLTHADINLIINRERTALYKKAKQQLKNR